MHEVSGAVVAIVLVLCAVFVPVAFLGGIAGQLYRQFAVTVAIAVVISGFIALTLTPVLCALLLHQGTTSRGGSDPSIAPSPGSHNASCVTCAGVWNFPDVRSRSSQACSSSRACSSNMCLAASCRPEDQGNLMVNVQLPDGATLERTVAVTSEFRKMIDGHPALDYAVVVNGVDLLGGGQQDKYGDDFHAHEALGERDMTSVRVCRRDQSAIRRDTRTARCRPSVRRLSAVSVRQVASRSMCRLVPGLMRRATVAGAERVARCAGGGSRTRRHQYVLSTQRAAIARRCRS